MELKELPRKIVHCETREEYDKLLVLYREAGWKFAYEYVPEWDSRHFVDIRACWDRWSKSTAHNPMYYDEILSLSEFLQEQGISEELKAGDWVEVVGDFHSEILNGPHPIGNRYRIHRVDENSNAVIGQHPKLRWIVKREELSNLRKCSPPEKTPAHEEAEERKVTICQTVTPDAFEDTLYRQFLSCSSVFTPTKPISLPKSLMSAARNFIKRRRRSGDQNALIDAGLMYETGELSQEGKDALNEFLFEAYQEDLVKLAKDMNAEKAKKSK